MGKKDSEGKRDLVPAGEKPLLVKRASAGRRGDSAERRKTGLVWRGGLAAAVASWWGLSWSRESRKESENVSMLVVSRRFRQLRTGMCLGVEVSAAEAASW